jgi:hypothetical protein
MYQGAKPTSRQTVLEDSQLGATARDVLAVAVGATPLDCCVALVWLSETKAPG